MNKLEVYNIYMHVKIQHIYRNYIWITHTIQMKKLHMNYTYNTNEDHVITGTTRAILQNALHA